MANEASVCEFEYNDLLTLLQQLETSDNIESIGYAEVQLRLVETSFMNLKKSYREFYFNKTGNLSISFDMTSVQTRYAKTTGKLYDFIRRSKQSDDEWQQLPPVKIPEFDGNILNWKQFNSIFSEMVHRNNNLDDSVKMHHLKTLVKGEAARIINHISPTAENYTTCYDLLQKRFENKRVLVGQILDKILELPAMEFEDSQELKNMHDIMYEAYLELKNMDIDAANWNPFLVHLLIRKLDPDTIKHYECQLTNVKEYQGLHEFLKYIENRFMALESAEMNARENVHEHEQ